MTSPDKEGANSKTQRPKTSPSSCSGNLLSVRTGAKMTSNLENYIIIRVLKTGKKKSEVIARDPEAAVPRSSPPGIKSRARDPEVTGAEGAVPACRPEVCTSRRLGSIYGERLFL